MNERRVNRLESLIKEKIATVLLRDMADPRLGLVTITRVKLDREMALCKVYWSVLGGEKERKTNERTLQHARGYVRREIASILNTRSVPAVEFVFDESVAGALRVESILKQLRDERGERPDADAAGDTDEIADTDEVADTDEDADDAADADDSEGLPDDPDDDPDDDSPRPRR